MRRHWAWWALAIYAVPLGVLVFSPVGPHLPGGLPFGIRPGVVAAAANVALFVPVGFLSASILPRGFRWLSAVLSFFLTTSIEVLQALFLPERDGNVRDIITNTAGGAIGLACCYVWLWLRRPSRPSPVPTEPHKPESFTRS